MKTVDLVLVALFAGLIVVFGLLPPVPLGFIPVPITMQTLGVMLAGVVLGARRGALACALVVLLVAIGLPILSGGRGGLGVFAGPTAGFLLGWIPGAFAAGLIAERLIDPTASGLRQGLAFLAAAVAGGIAVVYAAGIPWLAVVAHVGLAKAAIGSAAFLPGDLIKAAVAAMVARGVFRAYPLLPVRQPAPPRR